MHILPAQIFAARERKEHKEKELILCDLCVLSRLTSLVVALLRSRSRPLGLRIEQERTETTESRGFSPFSLILIDTRERQGRSAHSPRLARQCLPWETESRILNTNGVAAFVGRISGTDAATASRLQLCGGITQVARSSQP